MILKRFIIGLIAILLICSVIMVTYNEKLFSEVSAQLQQTLPIVWVDAGHGGMDTGTSGADGTAEKELNLAIAKKVKEALTLCGFQVKMTRESDCLINHNKSATIRNNKRNDLNARLTLVEETSHCVLLSIHQNYYTDTRYDGAQVFYSKHNPQNQILAESIQTSIASRLQPQNKRVIKTVGSEIFLLDHCTKTAVMIECGFMSNTKELSLLKNEAYQAKMALCIAMGLLSYYNVK